MDKTEIQSQLEKLKLERQQTLINFGAIEGKIETLEQWLASILEEERTKEEGALKRHRNGKREKEAVEG